MRFRWLAGLIALCAACGPGTPEPDGPAPEQAGEAYLLRDAPPIYALLGYRDQLQLTSEQVIALDTIARRMEEATAPLRQHLPRAGEQAAVPTEVVAQITANRRRAAEGVHEVLTPEQREQVCRLFSADRTAGPPRQGEPTVTPPQWFWCAPEGGTERETPG